MSDILERVAELVGSGQVRISVHGYDELAADRISVKDLIGGISRAKAIEVYPEYPKGPCVLVLQRDWQGNPVHVVWGIPKGETRPGPIRQGGLTISWREDNEHPAASQARA